MRKDKPLTATFYIGGNQVESLTDEQSEKMAQKVGEALSLYYAAHPEEYKKIKN